jgi:hypothetical protein
MTTVSITSNDGVQQSASAVLEVVATNPDFNQPALHIRQAGTRGGAAATRSLRRASTRSPCRRTSCN